MARWIFAGVTVVMGMLLAGLLIAMTMGFGSTRVAAASATGVIEGYGGMGMLQPADGATVVLGAGGLGHGLALAVAPDGAAETAWVEYFVDGAPVGWSNEEAYVVRLAGKSMIETGEHDVRAVLTNLDAGSAVLEVRSGFTLLYANKETDADNNGIPDNPFAVLKNDGDVWFSGAKTPTGNDRAVAIARWDGAEDAATHDGPVRVVLENLDAPGVNVVVAAPRALAKPGETLLLTVQTALDLPALLGADDAGKMAPEPEGTLVPGAQYVEISVLVSADGGATFDELDDYRLATHPIRLAMYGIEPDPELAASFYSHSTYVGSDPSAGILVEAEGGAWTRDNVVHMRAGAKSMEADLISLSVFAPYEGVSEEAEADAQRRDNRGRPAFPPGDVAFLYAVDSEDATAQNAGDQSGVSAKGAGAKAMDTVWVDFDYDGTELGTETQPFNTLGEGVAEVNAGGTVNVKGGNPVPWSSEHPLTVTKAITIQTVGGAAWVGAASGAPVANFSADSTSGARPLSVQFTNASALGGSPLTSASWDFGDGTYASTENSSHQYGQVGRYPVALTVTTAEGQDTETKTEYIEVRATLTTGVAGGGSVAPPSGTTYDPDANVQLTATPTDGDYEFDQWSGDLTGSSNPANLTMNSDKTVTAHFLYRPPDLDITNVSTPPPASAQAGDSFTVAWTVTNHHWGTGVSWVDAVYLSTDNALDAGDLELGSVEVTGGLGNGGSYASPQSLLVTVPDAAPGNYYLIIKTDAGDAISEILADAANNASAHAITLIDPVLSN